MPTYKGTKPGSTAVQPVSILKGSSQSKRKLPVVGDMATAAATVETPTNHGNKAARPQRTSLMARDTKKDDDLDIQ
jgi:hypothetical protein